MNNYRPEQVFDRRTENWRTVDKSNVSGSAVLQ